MRKTRQIIIKLCILLCSIFLSLLIFELVINALNLAPLPIYPKNQYELHPTIGHRFTANFSGCMVSEDRIKVCIKTNSVGLWDDKDVPYTGRNILVVGDSFTFGAYCCNLNETYPKITESKLLSNGYPFQVINAGIPGHEVKNELEMFKFYSEIINPEIGILTFFVGNDIIGQKNPYKYSILNGKLANKDKKRTTLVKFLTTHFGTYRLGSKFITDNFFKEKSHHQNTLIFYDRQSKEEYLEEIFSAERDFIEFRDYCEVKNISCFVNIIPCPYQILRASMGHKDIYWPQEHFIDFFNDNNIAYLDMTPYIDEMSYFLPKNGHWNLKGTTLVGEITAEKIIKTYLT